MFSVNVDKLMKMTPLEAESYAKAADTIEGMLTDSENILSVTGNGLSSFKLAAAFMEKGRKVLFIDADINQEVFVGKYKLGKNLKGILDFLRGETEINDLICVTNRANLDVVFTGSTEGMEHFSIQESDLRTALEFYADKYDIVVVQSDDEGRVASVCDQTVLIIEKDNYSELSAEMRVKELDKKGCFVLGVIIDE